MKTFNSTFLSSSSSIHEQVKLITGGSVSFHVGSSDRLVNRNIGENAALNEMPIKRLNPYRCAALNTLLIVSVSPT